MPIAYHELNALLSDFFSDGSVSVTDLAGDGDHYEVAIISPQFEGKSRIQQHQMVYKALGGRVGQHIHALSLTTKTP